MTTYPQYYAGAGVATRLPTMDFETFSGAGYVWDATKSRWAAPKGSTKKGLFAVGAAVYAMHPTAEVLSFAYDLMDGHGARRWRPGEPNPTDLFDHLARGGPIEAWNVAFELWVWNSVCVRRYGWPPLNPDQCFCAMAKARAHSLPGGLGKAAEVLQLAQQKNADGGRLLDKFSVPQNPTKKNPKVRIRPEDDPDDFERLVAYNVQDIVTEDDAAIRVPDLAPADLAFWRAHERINRRGIGVDLESVNNAAAIIEEAFNRYDPEMLRVTEGAVERASQLERLKGWLHGRGVHMDEMDEDAIDAALKRLNPASPEYRALEIRQRVGSAAVKKLYAFQRMTAPTGRIHDGVIFNGSHTGRSTGDGVQPSNFPNSGPSVFQCEGCNKHYGLHHDNCAHCGANGGFSRKVEWNRDAANDCIETMRTRSLDYIEYIWGDAFPAVAGSLRGMFVAAPGHDLLCSDYSAIEAVGLAALAGEEWRLDVFRTHGKIYEMSASKITGVPFEEYLDYKKRTGTHHVDRKLVGKVAELACFSGDTQVLTDSGYKYITDVEPTDLLWDGEQWWESDGVVCKGERTVMWFDGVLVTPSHPVAIGEGEWAPISEVSAQRRLSRLSYAFAETADDVFPQKTPFEDADEDTWQCEVYDIVNAGPRHRFTIRTNSGHLIVHNSGYQGWVGAWKAFGADAFYSDDEIKDKVLAWREASPMIVNFWHGLERCAHAAVMDKGTIHAYRAITFQMHGDALYMRLPSGRLLTYHRPRLEPSDRGGLSLSFEGWNTNPKNGPTGWIRKQTFGGRLAENCTQAACNDLLRFAILNLEAAGYPVVLHVYDEIVCEVPEGFGSVEEMERIMMLRPEWAKDWPIKAADGWRAKRYGK